MKEHTAATQHLQRLQRCGANEIFLTQQNKLAYVQYEHLSKHAQSW